MFVQKRCPVLRLLAGHGGRCPGGAGGPTVGPKSLGVALARKSPPEAVSVRGLRRQICSSKVPLRDAGRAARAGPTVPVPVPRRVFVPCTAAVVWWGPWGQLVALPGGNEQWRVPGERWAARLGVRVSPTPPAGVTRGDGAAGAGGGGDAVPAAGPALPARKQAVAVCAHPSSAPGPLVQPGWGAGSLHPSWSLLGGIQLQEPRAVLVRSPRPPGVNCPF